MFFSASQLQKNEGIALVLRIIQDDSARGLTVDRALASLSGAPEIAYRDSHLSEAPFWLLVGIPPSTNGETILEFPSPRATELTCWDSKTFELLGRGTRENADGLITSEHGGFTLDSGKLGGSSVLCRAKFSGPARISVKFWNSPDFNSVSETYRRDSGLVDGGLGILALFVFITAIINRETIYIIFAAWLFGNSRLAGLSAGWDTHWLGYPIPVDWMPVIHAFTMSIYYVLINTLFSRVFTSDLKRVGLRGLLLWNLWTCPLVLAITILPYRQYLPIMWVLTGIACVNIAVLLTRIIFVTRSSVAIWFSLAFVVVILSTFNEVLAAALGLNGLAVAANFVTAALFSSLMASLAIAQQMRDEKHERLDAERALRNTYEEIPIGLFTLDHAGAIVRANPTLAAMLGDDVLDGTKSWADFFGLDSWAKLTDVTQAGRAVDMELCDIHSQDADKWYQLQAKRTGGRIEGSLQDISERVKATARLTFMADHDPLTSIFNRRGIEVRLGDAIAAATPKSRCLLAYIDLDRFKLINDLYGHGTGDEVLRQISQRIQPELEEGDFLGRVGGDEFVIVFRRASLTEAAACCRRLIGAIENNPFTIDDKAFRVGGCVGLVDVGSSISVIDAIAGADRACREAKKGSGGQLVVYEQDSPAFNEREHELHILKRFGVDTAPEGLFVVMQPIMSLRTPYDSLNFEVLLRMYRPDNSVEPAWRIINTAEKNGRIALIDRWVLKTLLEWLDLNFDSLSRTRFVSINLSGGSLNDERFIEDAFAMIAQHPRSASRLCVEITESVAVSDIENTLRFVNRIREFGVKVALDDFGVGYTSFSYLHSLSADILKIDGSLVSAALAHPANLSIIEAIANLSSNLGMTSIAEWAGDLDTVKAMVDVGIDYVQSYAVGRPQMPESIVVAHSAADFIQDKQIEEYVRKTLVTGVTGETSAVYGRRKEDLH